MMEDSLGTIEEELELLDLSTDNDSGVDESTQGRPKSARGMVPMSPRIQSSRIPTRTSLPTVRPPVQGVRRTRSQSTPAAYKPRFNLVSSASSPLGTKKVPMNKVVVGTAPSPNLAITQSRVGSLSNAHHVPGGGQVKIESRRLDWCCTLPRTKTVRQGGHQPGGGDKKIEQRKLSWKAESKVGSLEKATHKPGGGTVRIESKRLDWKAEPKVGSTANIRHKPQGGDVQIYEAKVEWRKESKVGSVQNINHKAGGGDVRIYNQKLDFQSTNSRVGSTKNIKHNPGGGSIKIHDEKIEFRVGSKVGSLGNIKHRAGGGDKKIFDDKEYMKQCQGEGSLGRSGSSSLNSSIMGSTSLVDDRSGTLKRTKKVSDPRSAASSYYSAQVLRKLSPMSVGY